ncbi:GntR family transcriptional regulator [Microbacterium sp. 22242]|uniref:GntR family transcriptional regulator n=1 Tax=Microbacterium sp. 22242 TaxID=3453896 RepID=UPI003F874595
MTEGPEVREQLRDAILRGDYAPRQRLIEAELASEFGASRFALRNALIALAAEGLIELQPNRGARIREISVEEAVEITEIRRAVEGLVAARAAERATDADIEFLRGLGDDMRRSVDEGELLRYSDLNATLHSTLREIAQHTTATRMLLQLNGQMVRHQFRLSLRPGRPTQSLPEHLAIIDAVVSRDPAAAEAAMQAHVSSVIRTLSAPEDAEPRRASARSDQASTPS